MHEGFEALEVGVVVILDLGEVSLPSLSNSSSDLVLSNCSLFFCNSQIVQEVIECGRGMMLKV
jgi:hypothetical protein